MTSDSILRLAVESASNASPTRTAQVLQLPKEGVNQAIESRQERQLSPFDLTVIDERSLIRAATQQFQSALGELAR